MFCPSCGTAVQPGQKFCTECGGTLAGLAAGSTFAPSAMDESTTPPFGTALPPPSVTPTAAPVAPAAPADPFEATAALTVVEQTSPTGYDPNPWDAGATGAAGQWPAQGGDTGQV
ncbi:MAG: zinc ribbon domain-containing protein, partial [Ilumatobacteraceae bacterium]